MSNDKSYFFCGIGGSGMLPLALILAEQGARVAGSDRALDQGRSADKFAWLRQRGIALFTQDGSGLVSGEQILVASAAIEDSVPDVAAAIALGCARMTRAELLAELFNAAPHSIAVGGTSGKSTVTGMIGKIAHWAERDPTIMNGAVMKDFAGPDAPFASSRVGKGKLFISEVDESDGSIALFRPEVAVLNNISLDHKTMEELRALFAGFLTSARHAVWNADDGESRALVAQMNLPNAISFGFAEDADVRASDVELFPLSSRFMLHIEGRRLPVELRVPGRHNIANALAAIAAAHAIGIFVGEARRGVESFTGLARRFDLVGMAHDIAVIDDFGHNPDKVAATLATLKAFDGRVLAFFQPHGYGPIKVMGKELAAVFAAQLDGDDHVVICDPAYFGGTVDRSVGADYLVDAINAASGEGGVRAEHIPDRAACAEHLLAQARPGDRIVVMGARDDTLSQFAGDLVRGLADRQ